MTQSGHELKKVPHEPRSRVLILCGSLLLTTPLSHAQVGSAPTEGIAENPSRWHALINGTVVTEPGVSIVNGTVIIRDGLHRRRGRRPGGPRLAPGPGICRVPRCCRA